MRYMIKHEEILRNNNVLGTSIPLNHGDIASLFKAGTFLQLPFYNFIS